MKSLADSISPTTQAKLDASGGPLEVGPIVVMRRDVYESMLGVSPEDEAETLAAMRRGLAVVDAGRTGRTQVADVVLRDLQRRYES